MDRIRTPPAEICRLLDSILPILTPDPTPAEAGYALPDASLRLLTRIVQLAGLRSVFEFGSGLSTKAFLAAGCAVTAIENSRSWLDQTLASLTPAERSRLTPVCQPLRLLFHQSAPFRSWTLAPETLHRLASADLILIDSPAFPPFREHALALSLDHSPGALIVVDDARIPTVHRFCTRLASAPGTLSRETPLDHGLFFLIRDSPSISQPRRSLIETAKAWRRFLIARRYP